MRLPLLLLAVALLLPALGVAAKPRPGGAWTANRVVVRDHTPEDWRPYVQQAVADFNRMLPPRAPRLVYRAMPERPCSKRLRTHRPRKTIVVCTHPVSGYPGLTRLHVDRERVIDEVTVEFWGPMAHHLRATTVCHEFMHALTNSPESWRGQTAENSCVHRASERASPGKADRRFARRAYRAYDR